MADVLRQELGLEAELVRGGGGVFKVYVGDEVVARKTLDGFPTPAHCLDAVRDRLAPP